MALVITNEVGFDVQIWIFSSTDPVRASTVGSNGDFTLRSRTSINWIMQGVFDYDKYLVEARKIIGRVNQPGADPATQHLCEIGDVGHDAKLVIRDHGNGSYSIATIV